MKFNSERAAYYKSEKPGPRETARYKWAADNLSGRKILDISRSNGYGSHDNISRRKILDIGCSNGYGSQFLGDVEYHGFDYDQEILDVAKIEYPDGNYKRMDLEKDKITEYYDTIIAFEVLEHLDNCFELAQELKEHCDVLLLSVPYMEPKGFWGPHHKHHQLNKNHFKEFSFFYMTENGDILKAPNGHVINLLLMKWEKGKKYETVTAMISTKNRYFSTLPLAITSIANQTRLPEKLIIYDDGEHRDLRTDPTYHMIFKLLNAKDIEWYFLFAEGKGQVANHQKCIDTATTTFIWRVDDDNLPESNVLETLLKYATDDVGAIGGLVLNQNLNLTPDPKASNKMEDVYAKNRQWSYPVEHFKYDEVDHLYSTFLYRVDAAQHGYCKELSIVGHREETIFTYEMKLNGWKILLTPECITWHFQSPNGGIRDNTREEMWIADEAVFQKKLKSWKTSINEPYCIVLNNGLGDHYCFRSIIEDVKKKYKNLVLAVCYPDVFDDCDITLISIEEAKRYGDLDKWDVYKFMSRNQWKSSIVDAYKKMYKI